MGFVWVKNLKFLIEIQLLLVGNPFKLHKNFICLSNPALKIPKILFFFSFWAMNFIFEQTRDYTFQIANCTAHSFTNVPNSSTNVPQLTITPFTKSSQLRRVGATNLWRISSLSKFIIIFHFAQCFCFSDRWQKMKKKTHNDSNSYKIYRFDVMLSFKW
jgi:hypothetical protein